MNSAHIFLYVLFPCFVHQSTEKYHLSRRIRTDEDSDKTLYAFDTVLLKGLDVCIQTCKAKKKFRFINYHVRSSTCFLIGFISDENVVGSIERIQGYIFGDKTEWNMTEHSSCEDCNDSSECQKYAESWLPTCANVGCPFPEEKENATHLGNMFSVGSNTIYTCNVGYNMTNSSSSRSTCKENAVWSLSSFKCLPESFFTEDARTLDGVTYKLVRTEAFWLQARRNCKDLGGDLTDITSQPTQDIVMKLVSSTNQSVWIGGRTTPKTWTDELVWITRTSVESGYMNWMQGYPQPPNGMRRCMRVLEKALNYKWVDSSCDLRFYSVCKFI